MENLTDNQILIVIFASGILLASLSCSFIQMKKLNRSYKRLDDFNYLIQLNCIKPIEQMLDKLNETPEGDKNRAFYDKTQTARVGGFLRRQLAFHFRLFMDLLPREPKSLSKMAFGFPHEYLPVLKDVGIDPIKINDTAMEIWDIHLKSLTGPLEIEEIFKMVKSNFFFIFPERALTDPDFAYSLRWVKMIKDRAMEIAQKGLEDDILQLEEGDINKNVSTGNSMLFFANWGFLMEKDRTELRDKVKPYVEKIISEFAIIPIECTNSKTVKDFETLKETYLKLFPLVAVEV